MRRIDELFRLIERARILGNPMSISSSFTKVGHEPFHERNLYNSMGPIRPAHGVYNAKPSISFTSQSRERGRLFLPALKGSCMTSRCTSCLFVPLFHFSQELHVVYFVSGPNRPLCDYCQGLARLFLFNVLSIQKGIYRSVDSSNNPGCDCLSIDFCQSSKNFITSSYLSMRTRS